MATWPAVLDDLVRTRRASLVGYAALLTGDLASEELSLRETLSRLGVTRLSEHSLSEEEWLLMDYMFLTDRSGIRLSGQSFYLFQPESMTTRWMH